MKTKQEIGSIQERWLTALESGDYAQGERTLKQASVRGCDYCCLGVLCEVMGVPFTETNGIFYIADDHGGRLSAAIPDSVSIRAGLKGSSGYIREKTLNGQDSLAWANDHGATFAEIAAFCRAHPEAVFTEPR